MDRIFGNNHRGVYSRNPLHWLENRDLNIQDRNSGIQGHKNLFFVFYFS